MTKMDDINNQDIAIETLLNLYSRNMRSTDLVGAIADKFSFSEPTIYSTLKELQELELIDKKVKSSKNVRYTITNAGRALVENDYLKMKEQLVSIITLSQDRDIIILEAFIKDVERKLIERNVEINPGTNVRKILLKLGRPALDNMKITLFEQARSMVEGKQP